MPQFTSFIKLILGSFIFLTFLIVIMVTIDLVNSNPAVPWKQLYLGKSYAEPAKTKEVISERIVANDLRLYTADWTPSENRADAKDRDERKNRLKSINGYKLCNMQTGCLQNGIRVVSASCVHQTTDYVLRNGTVLKANSREDEGYCFFPKDGPSELCNTMTSTPLMTVTEQGLLRMMCRCYWPTLFDQKDIFSDCNIGRACNNRPFSLIHKKSKIPLLKTPYGSKINIHDYECGSCGDSQTPGTNPDTGLPACLPKPMNSRSYDMDGLYDVLVQQSGIALEFSLASANDRTTNAVLLPVNSVLVDKDMRKGFVNEVQDKARIPNPCAFDHFNGSFLDGECVLTSSRSGIAYCSPRSESVSTVLTPDDYLTKNNGRYSNACYRFTTSDANVHGYIFEYFVRGLSDESKTEFIEMIEKEKMAAAAEGRKGKDLRYPPPFPNVSLETKVNLLTRSIRNSFGLADFYGKLTARTNGDDDILITQAPVPDDAIEVPVPLDMITMSEYRLERNDYGTMLPALCLFDTIYCAAPIQTILIPQCKDVGNGTRNPSDANILYLSQSTFSHDELLFNSVVACKNPEYDERLNIVPQIDVARTDGFNNAAILRFDKKTKTVHPHWPASYYYEQRGPKITSYLNKLVSRPSRLVHHF